MELIIEKNKMEASHLLPTFDALKLSKLKSKYIKTVDRGS